MASEFPQKFSQHSAELCGLAPSMVPREGALWWLSRRCPLKEPRGTVQGDADQPGVPALTTLFLNSFWKITFYLDNFKLREKLQKQYKEFSCTFHPDSPALPFYPLCPWPLS